LVSANVTSCGYRKILKNYKLSQLFWHVIVRLLSLIRCLQRIIRFINLIYFYMWMHTLVLCHPPSTSYVTPHLTTKGPFFRCQRDISHWSRVSTQFISRGQYVALRRGVLSSPSSSFLFSRNGDSALCSEGDLSPFFPKTPRACL